MTDLVIKTCNGNYLVDMDPTVLEKLKAKYPDYQTVEVVPDYYGEKRIRLKPQVGKHINHIEVDVPPGCYVVWTRVCYSPGNDETNKAMVIVDCSGEACVNLLLDQVETCVKQALYPAAVRAIEKQLPVEEIGIAVKALMEVAEMPKKEFVGELERRIGELRVAKETEAQEYLKASEKILEILKSPQIRQIKK
jgi:hypothetical protein